MVKRIYLDDTYKFEHDTIVTQIGHDPDGRLWVRLDETIFHPQGGGQPFDRGEINGVTVVDVQNVKETDEVNHYLERELDVTVGERVHLAIDSKARLDYAALHSAGHLLGVLTEETYPLTATKGHHFPKQAHVEFVKKGDCELPESSVMSETLGEKFAKEQKEGTLIKTYRDEAGKRCVQIGSHPPYGCGGTHVSSMEEIGMFAIRRINQPKGTVKIGYDAQYQPYKAAGSSSKG